MSQPLPIEKQIFDICIRNVPLFYKYLQSLQFLSGPVYMYLTKDVMIFTHSDQRQDPFDSMYHCIPVSFFSLFVVPPLMIKGIASSDKHARQCICIEINVNEWLVRIKPQSKRLSSELRIFLNGTLEERIIETSSKISSEIVMVFLNVNRTKEEITDRIDVTGIFQFHWEKTELPDKQMLSLSSEMVHLQHPSRLRYGWEENKAYHMLLQPEWTIPVRLPKKSWIDAVRRLVIIDGSIAHLSYHGNVLRINSFDNDAAGVVEQNVYFYENSSIQNYLEQLRKQNVTLAFSFPRFYFLMGLIECSSDGMDWFTASWHPQLGMRVCFSNPVEDILSWAHIHPVTLVEETPYECHPKKHPFGNSESLLNGEAVSLEPPK